MRAKHAAEFIAKNGLPKSFKTKNGQKVGRTLNN